VRRRGGRKRALGTRALMTIPQDANQRWSLDFVSDTLTDGRRFRILCVIDDFSRECLTTVVDHSMSGERVARELDIIAERRGYPCMIVIGQRHRADLERYLGLAGESACRMALHRTGQANAERLRGKLQWSATR
jgi:transposase InsO family protein